MTTNLKDYFKLGLDSTDDAGEQAGLINTIRTPVDTSSTQLNRVTFKVPKIGMLTADSHLNLRFTAVGRDYNTVNVINGALGCISRFRILLGNRVLTDLENPAMLENVKMYSNATLTHLNDFESALIGNSLMLETNVQNGNFILSPEGKVAPDTDGDAQVMKDWINQDGSCKTYALPLRKLGASFLETASLPVFLLGSREMIIEITFHDDAREYGTSGNNSFSATNLKVDLINCELVTTHVMLDEKTEAEQMADLVRNPAQYPLTDTYVIKAVLPSGSIGVKATNLYRLNIQNREVHRVLMVFKSLLSVGASHNDYFANQHSEGCGDESLQVKANGLDLFTRPITNSATIYQLLNYYNGGVSMKMPYQLFHGTAYSTEQLSFDPDLQKEMGLQHYIGLDFKNGNSGIQGSGTVMTSALEVDYSNTPNNGNGESTQDEPHDILYYVSISKMLTIGSNMINVSF